MNKVSFFKKLTLPFYSGEYYRHVARNNKGFGFKTFFVVLSLNWLVMLLIFCLGFFRLITDPEFQNAKAKLAHELPTITIEDGQASISEPTPYLINIPQTNQPLVVFISENDKIDSGVTDKAILVVSENEIQINKQNSGETRILSIKDFDDIQLDGNMIVSFVEQVFWISIPVLMVIIIFTSFLFRLLQVFVFAAIGQIFNSFFGTSLVYDQLCRLTTLALTPVLILDLVLFFIWSGPKLWFFNFFLAMTFLGFGVSSQKETQKMTVV